MGPSDGTPLGWVPLGRLLALIITLFFCLWIAIGIILDVNCFLLTVVPVWASDCSVQVLRVLWANRNRVV